MNLTGLLTEGIESLRLPCTWVLLIPGAAVMLFGRRRTPLVVASFSAVALAIVWLRWGGNWFEVPSGGIQVAIGVVIMAGAAIAWKLDHGVTDGISAGITGGAAAWAWIPCVGPDLGGLLNSDWDNPITNLPGTAAFMIGQFLPFIVLAAGGVLVPQIAEKLEHRAVITTGAIMVALIGLAFVTQTFDDLASELARRSNPADLALGELFSIHRSSP